MLAWRVAALGGLFAVALATGCGDGSSSSDEAVSRPTAPLGGEDVVRVGSIAQLATCTNWKRGTVAQRRDAVAQLSLQLTAEQGADPLSPDQAYEILDSACSEQFTAAFRLYKIYYRAQAFSVLSTPEGIEEFQRKILEASGG